MIRPDHPTLSIVRQCRQTGRGAAAPATTPRGAKSPAPLPSHAANQANRGPRFEGMERICGKAGNPPSDAARTPVRRDRSPPSGAQDSAPGHAAVDGKRSWRTVQSARSAISSTRPAISSSSMRIRVSGTNEAPGIQLNERTKFQARTSSVQLIGWPAAMASRVALN